MENKKVKRKLVQLARTVRETATIVVEYEEGSDIDLREVYYEFYEHHADWERDDEWGSYEETHQEIEDIAPNDNYEGFTTVSLVEYD